LPDAHHESETEIRGWIVAFLRRRLGPTFDPDAIGDDVPLYDAGWIDSLGILELVQTLESRLGTTLPREDLATIGRATLRGIVETIRGRMGPAQADPPSHMPQSKQGG